MLIPTYTAENMLAFDSVEALHEQFWREGVGNARYKQWSDSMTTPRTSQKV
jgi:hypothetical protein